MAKTKISEFDSNPANNTDIDGINLAEGMAPGLVNNAIRELMAQLKNFQTGSDGDNVSVGGNLAVTGTTALTGAVTVGGNVIDAFPSGTKMLFNQTAAPTGWTKDTTHDNKALRVVSGSAGTGGSVSFTTAFASQSVSGTVDNTTATNQATTAGGTVADHTLTINQIPSHTHGATKRFGSIDGQGGTNFGGVGFNRRFTDGSTSSDASGGGGAHSHGFTGTSHNHTQNPHTHNFTGSSIDLAVQYVDVIICTKS